jgi:hypothetical protein
MPNKQTFPAVDPVRALLNLAIVAVLAGGATAVAAHGNDHAGNYQDGQGRVCSSSAKTLLKACASDTDDNYLVAVATCQNLADTDARKACMDEAKSTRDDDASGCHDVYQARLEVCDVLGTEGPYDPHFGSDYAGNFVDPLQIGGQSVAPNPYFPLVKDNQWKYYTSYENEDGDNITENDTVTVTDRTKLIEGVTCVVVTDVVEASDGTVEDTEDWYTQDLQGNVWYCGESSAQKETFDGDNPPLPELVAIDGSWKTGREGAKPGIQMFANPDVGKTYRQELDWAEAEDVAKVLATDADESAHGGEFQCNHACVETRDYTALEPDADEHKYYAPGVGLMLEVDLTNGARNELVSFSHPNMP